MINMLLLQNLILYVFNARLSQANLVTTTNFDNTVSSLDSKTAKNKTKNESIENKKSNVSNFMKRYELDRSDC